MDISTYASQNTIPAKHGRKCVDGRYGVDDENAGMLARPGGDLGYSMALLALSQEGKLRLSPVDCFEKVYSVLQEMGEDFYMHTDDHALHTEIHGPVIGCGHAAKPTSTELAAKYSVTADDMLKLVEHAKAAVHDNKIHMVNLHGEHAEKGVLVVTSTANTVRSQNEGEMYFIYDKTRDDAFVAQLFAKLKLIGVTIDDFKRVLDLQLGATLELLAKGLPVYEVNVDNSTPLITHKGNI